MTTRKFQAQADEMESILRRTGFTIEEIARKTGINVRTLKNAATGGYKLGDLRMQVLRNVGSVPVYDMKQLGDSGIPEGDPIKRLRYIPVVSWTKAGEATAYLDLPGDWMRRIPSDATDPDAFGVDIVGDSMEPNYREGETAILLPNQEARNGNLVVGNLKNDGVLMKIFHAKGSLVTLTSFNPAYKPQEFHKKDFHWIYPVESVVKRLLR